MNPTVSIIIINWNGWSDLKKCLYSLQASEYTDYEIIVIDNASSDGSQANVRKYFPAVILQENTENLGHTGGFNQGVKLCSGKYILLLDNDTVISPDVIGGCVAFMEQRRDVSLVSPRIYNVDGSLQETARNFPSPMSGLFGRHSLLTRMFPNNPFSRKYLLRDRLDENEPYPVNSISSACMFFNRELLDEVGAWDTDYPGYWVDVDWCMRLREHNKIIYCLPGLSIIHDESIDPKKKKSARRYWIFHYGAYLLYRKHYTFGMFDPRSVLAFMALSTRAGLLIAGTWFRQDDEKKLDKIHCGGKTK